MLTIREVLGEREPGIVNVSVRALADLPRVRPRLSAPPPEISLLDLIHVIEIFDKDPPHIPAGGPEGHGPEFPGPEFPEPHKPGF